MEKQTKLISAKLKFLRFLPKASAINFQNLPFSPIAKAHAAGPLSIVPAEARSKPKNYEAHEPTSPKISCMGQIKCKKNRAAANKQEHKVKRAAEKGRTNKPMRARHVSVDLGEKAPSLSQMKRFASGRDSLGKFEWTAEISVGEPRKCYTDGRSVRDDEEEKIVVNGVALVPKKEINLWKRRTMAQPRPLRI